MNTITTPTHLRRMIATAIFSVLASSLAAVCTAADSTDAPQTLVKVCRPLDNNDPASKMRMYSCIRKAIADAVTNVNQPALFAVYNAKNNKKSQPTILVAGQTR